MEEVPEEDISAAVVLSWEVGEEFVRGLFRQWQRANRTPDYRVTAEGGQEPLWLGFRSACWHYCSREPDSLVCSHRHTRNSTFAQGGHR